MFAPVIGAMTRSLHVLFLVVTVLTQALALPTASAAASAPVTTDSSINTVLVVFMNHLDVGCVLDWLRPRLLCGCVELLLIM